MEELTTIQLLDIIANIEAANWTMALQELESRVIQENDADDTPQHRGGIRPTHAPIVP